MVPSYCTSSIVVVELCLMVLFTCVNTSVLNAFYYSREENIACHFQGRVWLKIKLFCTDTVFKYNFGEVPRIGTTEVFQGVHI